MFERNSGPQIRVPWPIGAKADNPVQMKLIRRNVLQPGSRNHGLTNSAVVAEARVNI